MNKPLWGRKPSQFADTEPASTMPMTLPPGGDFDAPTEPMPLSARPTPPRTELSLAPVEAGEYELMAELRKDNRVCPQPTRWLEFFRLLQDHAGRQPLPSPPLTGSAWAATPPSAKRMCFREQAEWAVQNGCVAEACEFLAGLPKSDWLYAD
ncbi:hypothetical protein LZ009_10265 [Ramlibacter sp. XY19]|uniref:hypothetical protein n=1 Tax=Ramlibacter paludis TaxID=2908000 RepID=UPI0023DA9A7F|nr:hypothetical protein [Ramlibacter paludis]MCG2593165.1 hypothetical protein [Ramlibacter paludis]